MAVQLNAVKKMMKSRKGFFFSVIAFFMVLMLVMSFRVATRVDMEKNKLSAEAIRIKILNNFVYDLEERYLERMLVVSSKAGLKEMSKYSSINNKAFDDAAFDGLNAEFNSVVLNGSLSNGEVILDSYTFSYYAKQLQDKFADIGINVSKLEVRATLTQKDEFTVNVNADLIYEVIDSQNTAGWRGKINKNIEVDITGFIDPEVDEAITKTDWKKTGSCGECTTGGCNFIDKLAGECRTNLGICNAAMCTESSGTEPSAEPETEPESGEEPAIEPEEEPPVEEPLVEEPPAEEPVI